LGKNSALHPISTPPPGLLIFGGFVVLNLANVYAEKDRAIDQHIWQILTRCREKVRTMIKPRYEALNS
jgi:hypothetical protein